MDSISVVLDYVNSIDIDSWVLWVLYPILITFLLPSFIILFLYLSSLMLFIYKQRMKLKAAYDHDFWDGARKTLGALWWAQARTWHGYEVEGLHHIPESGPALIIYYHGVLPVDIYYVLTTVLLEKGRLIHLVGDKFLFHIPGWQTLMEVFNVTPGTVTSCVDQLKNGHLLCISPGGVREGLFSDENYGIMWNKRCGFAKVALQANVPIIPMFTVNIREAFRTPNWARAWFRGLYEKTRLPLAPVYGLFPVKLKTIFGEPILANPNFTAEELAEAVKSALESLIATHQKCPGNILRALLERIPFFR
ncbi:monoacylglycerol/Diacylglycerol O-acyltransferase-like [Physella acuta]|uniref:monoacylglycerol/Diacylglycerol O-acyltransferase-like n=1 Tax=Physella acuta TaxID=109671 RepID=UPI0027DC0C6C|nr:monoacylglycerol/Diacylglycerol O-acyltransferase-like [Physella acuta]